MQCFEDAAFLRCPETFLRAEPSHPETAGQSRWGRAWLAYVYCQLGLPVPSDASACAGLWGGPVGGAALCGVLAGGGVKFEAGDPSRPHKEGCVVTGHASLPGPLPARCFGDSHLLCFLGQLGEKQVPSSTSDDRVKDEFSDLSEG